MVDQLTKMPRFITSHTSTSATNMVNIFLKGIWRRYGLPDTIVSNYGTQFASGFWQQFGTRLAIQLRLSTAFHYKTNSQGE
jgi:hypothetical protein